MEYTYFSLKYLEESQRAFFVLILLLYSLKQDLKSNAQPYSSLHLSQLKKYVTFLLLQERF